MTAPIGLPSPRESGDDGIVTWEGGVRVIGPLLVIPGRALDVDHLEEAERHAWSVLAAVERLRGS